VCRSGPSREKKNIPGVLDIRAGLLGASAGIQAICLHQYLKEISRTKLEMPFASEFAKQGLCLSRGAFSEAVALQVRVEALKALAATNAERTWLGSFALAAGIKLASGDMNPIHSPWQRHVIILPMMMQSESLLIATQALASVAKTMGYQDDARLVELSAAITLPGALPQPRHTDICPTELDVNGVAPIVTIWGALGEITEENGPTIIEPGSHLRYRERAVRQTERCVTNANGAEHGRATVDSLAYEEGNEAALNVLEREAVRQAEEDEARERDEFGSRSDAVPVLLAPGDACAMDSRVSHWGSGYDGWWASRASQGSARILLNASFSANPDPEGKKVVGFTYHGASGINNSISHTTSIGEILRACPDVNTESNISRLHVQERAISGQQVAPTCQA
jgi:hypothetical protein